MKLNTSLFNIASAIFQLWKTLVMFLFIFSLANPVIAQIKIYINTDLEGISGVYKFAQTREKGTPLNIQACEYFMGDLAAVIRGLRDGGATEIVVLDGHGNQAIIPHLMIPGATYVTGKPRPGVANLTGLDESFSAMVMLGFHAMMGTADGVLNHTQSSKSENRYWYNGIESGELAQNAAIAGHFGVPLIMFTGDEATCREARTFFGEDIVTVATKRGLSREAAELYSFKENRKALYLGAKRSIEVISRCEPYRMELPIKGKLQYLDLNPNLPEPKLIIKEKVFDSALDILKF